MPLQPILLSFLLAAVLFLPPVTTRATTIAAVVTPENIVIAADSLVTKLSGNGPAGIGFAEKLEAFGPTIVAAGGLAKAGTNSFEVFQVVSEACRNSYGVDAQARVFADLMRSKLPAVVTSLREHSKSRTGFPAVLNSTVWFCGLENLHPVIYAVHSEIGLGVESPTKIAIHRYPPDITARGSGVIFMGPDSLRGREFDLNPRKLREVPYLVSAANDIVRTGISDPQGRSGGAVTIVHISKEGNRLISKS